MSVPDLAELRALWEAATPGPWEFTDGFTLWAADGTILSTDLSDADAALIVAMHAALPQLLARIERLQARESDASMLFKRLKSRRENIWMHLNEPLRETIDVWLGVPGSLVEPTPEET